MALRTGSTVEWKWGSGKGTGRIVEIFHEDVEKTIEGKAITRKASKEDPAYLIEQENGQTVLKGRSEVSAAS